MVEISAPDLVLSVAEANSSNRWIFEQRKLDFFPSVRFVGAGGKITAAVGTLDTHSGNTYGIRVDLTNFPYSLASVFPRDWQVHPEAPHKYRNGSLCIMRNDQWRFHFTVALVLAKTAIWLGKYEIWKRNGHAWPGLEQSH
jgi:hypothetical protein